jgi:hypothetical protein
MTIRVKLVINMINDGASVSSVITTTIWMAVLKFWRSFPLPIWKLTIGALGAATLGARGAVGAIGAAGGNGALGEIGLIAGALPRWVLCALALMTKNKIRAQTVSAFRKKKWQDFTILSPF